ncbi:MAG: L,D-transpeptidase family protein [Verrucomicrobiota bacterium]
MKFLFSLALLAFPLFPLFPLTGWAGDGSAGLPEESAQIILVAAEQSRATVFLLERGRGGWQQVLASMPARIGKNGLAAGLGLHPRPGEKGLKVEGDGKTPTGIFEIPAVWGYAASVPTRMPYRQVTSRDLWVEDVDSVHYNRHLRLPHEPASDWERKAQMRQNDLAHALKIEIAHNTRPHPEKGKGSAIFMHIWRRQGQAATAGCVVVSEGHLRRIVAWLRPESRPVQWVVAAERLPELRRALRWGDAGGKEDPRER